MCDWCGDGWRFETTILGGPDSGQVKAVLHPISAEWEETYSAPSTGSIVVATQDPAVEDIWPGATGLFISQVMPDGSRRARFGGFVEKFTGSGGGATTIAVKSIDGFLENRLMVGPANPYSIIVAVAVSGPGSPSVIPRVLKPVTPTTTTTIYTSPTIPGGQAALASFYVNLARGGLEGEGTTGVGLLSAVADEPYDLFPGGATLGPAYIAVNWWDFKNIGQAIRELVEAENGVKYWIEHTYTDGFWASVMHFSDVVGEARDYTILSDREANQYGLEVDAENKATRVYGVGAGDEGYTSFSVAYDADDVDNQPEHQATVAWKDQTEPLILDSLTRGYVIDHRDPTTVPSATIVGLPDYDPDVEGYDPAKGFPGPEILRPGDTFNVEIGYGVITVKDILVRALAVAWRLQPDRTTERVIAMQPIIRANTSVRTQVPAKAAAPTNPVANVPKVPKQTNPWPTPGLVSRVGAPLTEISGMQRSEINPGYVWVFNDEKETPQVYLVRTSTGAIAGSFTPNPGVSSSPAGDPEAIRISQVTGKLVLADIGDNDNNRPTSGADQPHLIVLPEPKGVGAKGVLPAQRLPIAYPGGLQVNAETLLIHPATDEVLIITKEPTQARVYSFGPLSAMSTVNNVGTLVDTLSMDLVSDGTHTKSGAFVLLRGAKNAATIVVQPSTGWRHVGSIPTPPLSKGEAITVENSCAFLVTTEGSPAPIYRVLIPKTFGALCDTQEGSSGTGTGGGTTTAAVPGQLINLQPWKLQLPI